MSQVPAAGATLTVSAGTRPVGPTESAQSKPLSDSKGLSNGAKAGIAVGCTVGALVGIILFLTILRRTRKRIQQSQPEATHEDSSNHSIDFHKPELPSNQHPPQEMALGQDAGYGLPPYEVSGDASHQELQGDACHQELQAKTPTVSLYELPVPTPRRRNFESLALPPPPKSPVRKDSAPDLNMF